MFLFFPVVCFLWICEFWGGWRFSKDFPSLEAVLRKAVRWGGSNTVQMQHRRDKKPVFLFSPQRHADVTDSNWCAPYNQVNMCLCLSLSLILFSSSLVLIVSDGRAGLGWDVWVTSSTEGRAATARWRQEQRDSLIQAQVGGGGGGGERGRKEGWGNDFGRPGILKALLEDDWLIAPSPVSSHWCRRQEHTLHLHDNIYIALIVGAQQFSESTVGNHHWVDTLLKPTDRQTGRTSPHECFGSPALSMRGEKLVI